MNSLVSVIIPVFNSEKTLPACLESIAGQKVQKEIIFADDGSTDAGKTFCRQFAEKSSFPVKLTGSAVNSGPASARNLGLQMAEGKYVFFMDSDDTAEPDMLETLFNAAEKENADWTIADFNMIDGSVNRRAEAFMADRDFSTGRDGLLEEVRTYLDTPRGASFFTNTWGKLYKLQLIREKNLRFDPELRTWEDTVFNCRYAEAARSLVYVRKHLYNYCVHPGQKTGGTKLFEYPFGHKLVIEVLCRFLSGAGVPLDRITCMKHRAIAYFTVKNLIVAAALCRSGKCRQPDGLRNLIRCYMNDPETAESFRDFKWRRGESFWIPVLLRLKLGRLLESACMRKVSKGR